MKLNLGSGRFPLDGFENLTEPDWEAATGLRGYADRSVEAVTVSHLLMYLDWPVWRLLFSEIMRVLEPGGFVRVTEDETLGAATSRPGVQPGATVATTRNVVKESMRRAGFAVRNVEPTESGFKDGSLIQNWHGSPPDVFHVEGVKHG